jgi:hypothetical protein
MIMAWKREGGGYFNEETNLRIFKIEDPQTGKAVWQVQDLNGAPVGDLHRTLKDAKASTE